MSDSAFPRPTPIVYARGDGIGLGDYHDVMTGVDAVIELGIADPDRLALRG